MMRPFFRWVLVLVLGSLLLVGVLAQTTQPETLLQLELFNIRNDQAILADRLLGAEQRPEGWLDNDVLDSDSILADLFINNELLADEVYGTGERPDDWIGATTRDPNLIARNTRHDLELMANDQFGSGVRPDDWEGSEPIFTCSRTVMNLALVLDQEYNLRPTTPASVRDYCFTVTNELLDDLIVRAIGEVDNQANTLELLLATRGDLERTADEVFGVNQRPAGWLDNTDISSSDFNNALSDDLDLLADEQLGTGERPVGWIPEAAAGSDLQVLQNTRFNLELITDVLLGEGVRPRGWQGGTDPLLRCDPVLQNLILLAQETFEYELPQVDFANPDYCAILADDVNNRIENPPEPEPELDPEGTPIDQQFLGTSELAFTYLDLAAIEYMGVMPLDTQFRAWYRNFGDSTMMFVSGENFAVFLDRRWTSITQDTFNRLPTLDGVRPLTFCDAAWCNGPSPTPTPTGRGPLLDIIVAATPAVTATPVFGSEFEQTEVAVNWEAIRINYLLQRPEVGVAQVTLEICRDSSQVACEAVTSVTNAAGEQLPVLSQFNGLNVYELPYGYNTGLTIRGTRFVSNDIWLLDPSALGG